MWNQRYADGDYVPRTRPAPFLEEWLPRLTPGRALDIACGTGRNALRLAEAGYEVDAVDISEVAIDRARAEADRRGVKVNWIVSDLNEFEIRAAAYQVITVIRYRNPALWPKLVAGLAPEGWILVDHHVKTSRPAAGPSSPEFRLDPQELLRAFASLRIVYYTETTEPSDRSDDTFVLARIVACKGDAGL